MHSRIMKNENYEKDEGRMMNNERTKLFYLHQRHKLITKLNKNSMLIE